MVKTRSLTLFYGIKERSQEKSVKWIEVNICCEKLAIEFIKMTFRCSHDTVRKVIRLFRKVYHIRSEVKAEAAI